MKRAAPESEPWCLEFPLSSHVTNVVHAISHLDGRITMHMRDGAVTTQAVASSKSCMVTANLSCPTATPGEEAVCLDAVTLLRALRACSRKCVRMEQLGDQVRVSCISDPAGVNEMEWTLPILVDESMSVELDPMDYDCEWVYETSAFKQDLRRCQDMEGDDVVTLTLLRHTGDDATVCSCLELEAGGDRGDVCIRHRSSTRQDGDGAQGDAGVAELDRCEYAVQFKQQYHVAALVDFLKAVELPSVKLLLGNGKPLIVEAVLSLEASSSMCFVQGPHAMSE